MMQFLQSGFSGGSPHPCCVGISFLIHRRRRECRAVCLITRVQLVVGGPVALQYLYVSVLLPACLLT